MAHILACHLRVDSLGSYPEFAEDVRPTRALFSFDTAAEIARDWEAHPLDDDPYAREAYYDPGDDSFHLYDPAPDEWLSWQGEPFGPVTLYAIGDGSWTWEVTA